MEHYYHFEITFIDLKMKEIIDLFEGEGFDVEDKFYDTFVSKNIGKTDPFHKAKFSFVSIKGGGGSSSKYDWEFMIKSSKGEPSTWPGVGTIFGEKEEIIDFFKYFLNLAEKEDILFEPIKLFLDEPQSVYIDIESEEDIYAIFDENSPRVRRFSQI